MAKSIRSDRMCHRQLGTSHGCQDHTVLPYASSAFHLAHGLPLMRFDSPCDHPVRRRPRVHHIPPRVRDDRDTPLLSRRDRAEIATDLGGMGSRVFSRGRLDDPNQIEIIRQIGLLAQRLCGLRKSASLPVEGAIRRARLEYFDCDAVRSAAHEGAPGVQGKSNDGHREWTSIVRTVSHASVGLIIARASICCLQDSG
jgi:hypothetical protein